MSMDCVQHGAHGAADAGSSYAGIVLKLHVLDLHWLCA